MTSGNYPPNNIFAAYPLSIKYILNLLKETVLYIVSTRNNTFSSLTLYY